MAKEIGFMVTDSLTLNLGMKLTKGNEVIDKGGQKRRDH